MPSLPCALSVAGLDPSGGAGVLADVRAFEAAGAWGCAVVAVTTVQSTAGMRASRPSKPAELGAQLREVLRHQDVRVIKVGALGSAANVRAVLAESRRHPRLPLVVDPVMLATRGRGADRLLAAGAMRALLELIACSTLVTPNASEAAALVDRRVTSLDDARSAARALRALGARAALVKGGHLTGERSVDVLAVGNRIVELSAPRVARAQVHGTGCTLASLIAGRLAVAEGPLTDERLVHAVRWAKAKLGRMIARPLRIGDGLAVLRP